MIPTKGNFMLHSLGEGECLAFFPLRIKGKMVLQERIELSTSATRLVGLSPKHLGNVERHRKRAGF
jgi:hypothetical protein